MRICLPLTLLIGLGGVAAAQAKKTPPAPVVSIKVDQGEVTATELIERWARATGRLSVVDPQVKNVHVEFAEPGEVDSLTLIRLLDFHDIVVVENGLLINAHHRRNLAQKEGPPWDMVEDAAALANMNRVVTHIIPIKHGAGNQIFATVRGLLTRDTNRIGNILYVQGPELIIICDLSEKVAYYRQVIERLDAEPDQRRVRVTLVEMPRAQWKVMRDKQGAALHAALEEASDGGQATLLDQSELVSIDGRFRMTRQLTSGQGGRIDLNLSAESPRLTTKDGKSYTPPSPEVELRMDLQVRSGDSVSHRTLTLPVPRRLEAGDHHQASFTGREGTVIVISLQIS